MTDPFKAFEPCHAPKTLLETLVHRCAMVRPTDIIQKKEHKEGYVSISKGKNFVSLCLWKKGKEGEVISFARFCLEIEDYLSLCSLKPLVLASYRGNTQRE